MSAITLAILAALLGLAFSLVGYRFFLVMLPIWGFFAGFWMGAYGASLILGSGFLSTAMGWIVGLLFGVFAAVFSYLFYTIGVAIVAAGFGAALGSGVMTAIGFDPGLVVAIVAIISAIVTAALTLLLNLQKYVIILISAIAGGSLLVMSALLLFGKVTPAEVQSSGNVIKPMLADSWFWLLVWLALTAAGVVVQIITNRNYDYSKDRLVEGWG